MLKNYLIFRLGQVSSAEYRLYFCDFFLIIKMNLIKAFRALIILESRLHKFPNDKVMN